jgi:hypothetical protein
MEQSRRTDVPPQAARRRAFQSAEHFDHTIRVFSRRKGIFANRRDKPPLSLIVAIACVNPCGTPVDIYISEDSDPPKKKDLLVERGNCNEKNNFYFYDVRDDGRSCPDAFDIG